jgi:hypothetical protein
MTGAGLPILVERTWLLYERFYLDVGGVQLARNPCSGHAVLGYAAGTLSGRERTRHDQRAAQKLRRPEAHSVAGSAVGPDAENFEIAATSSGSGRWIDLMT